MSLMSKLKLKPTGPIYPWTQINQLEECNPFPRYGHSSNECAINNQIFIFGGIVEGKPQNDVFVIETDKLHAYRFTTSGDIPHPRSGHTHVNIGNYMIVFGGLLTYLTENPTDFIYILNTVTRQWSKLSIPEKNFLTQRHGHSATIIGTSMYIFGGQNFQGIYLNDLIVFDLATIESQNLSWKFISPSNCAPPSRAGHVACAYKDNIYIFGGTDGIRCYNDMWCYDTQNNSWSEISLTDFNPLPRCYHKAALVDDVIYVFGGITDDKKELSDLTAFRINQKTWHIFQKMGPTPSPCYGHTMTTADDKAFIFGGVSIHSKGIIHVLDTSKIKFPTGSYLNTLSQQQLQRRSSESSISTSQKLQTRETSNYTNEQNNNTNIKNQKLIFRMSQITNLQSFITRPGGPKRRVKSPLEKVTESLPEIEDNRTVDENLKTSTDNAKMIEKEKFSEAFDKVPTGNINGTNSNIEHTRNIKSAFDETQLRRPQDVQTVDQLSDNFHDSSPTINKHSSIVRDDVNFSNSSDRPASSEYYRQSPDDHSNMDRESYLERLQEQDFKLAEFKKREFWLKTQLELAKKNGYTPDSPDKELNDDIDAEKLSDSEEIGSEKFSIIRFIIQLSQQLQHAKEITVNQSKLASEKIANIESKVEKTTNLLNNIQAIKEQLLQIKRQLEASKQIAVKPEYSTEKGNPHKTVSERCESEEARPSKEISESYNEIETFYEIAEIEDMIRLVESKAARTQRQLKEIKQKANQIGSDYQMIHMYAQSAEKLMKMMKDQLINADKEGLEAKLKKAVNTHDSARTSIQQDYINQQSLKQQLKTLKKEKLQQISHMQTQIAQIQDEKALVDQEYEELKRMYSPLKTENDALRKSNELLKQQILTSENMKENLEQEIEQTKSSFKQQETLDKEDESEEEKCWEEEKTLKESEINLYKEKNYKLAAINEELEQKLNNSENKVAMLLDQMESIIEVYRSIGDVFDLPNEEDLPTLNFKIQEPRTSEVRDDYFDNLVKEKYPDLPSFVLPEFRSSPTDTEFSEIVSFDENYSDIDVGKSSDLSSKNSYFEKTNLSD
ncbi:26795_t:CDS:10 [Dentiscutata erythropus]|uniref:26795_t:CDS:1 n=1 Tax=Dentiscutata erythropus TaxID=1348616 RepID=A0A9N8WD33_9GLOM|nr:26795_t:CDS:10 [Dentiscutata erythropus]